MPTDTSPFGARMRELRERAGLKHNDAEVLTREHFGPAFSTSHETVRRWEVGAIDEYTTNPLAVTGVVILYAERLGEDAEALLRYVSPHIYEQTGKMLKLMSKRLQRQYERYTT